MSKMNEKEVREMAEKYADTYQHLSCMNGYASGVIRDLLALLNEKDEVIGRLRDDDVKSTGIKPNGGLKAPYGGSAYAPRGHKGDGNDY